MVEFSDVRYARSTDGIDIAYQTAGSGPRDLIFVPGFTSHLDIVWDLPFFNWILQLDGQFRITTFDKRGTGLSDRSLGFGSLDERADDIRAVMDACGIERAPLWGISEGGPLCILFAATYPHRASHLGLYGTGPRFSQAAGFPFGMPMEEAEALLEASMPQWGTGSVMPWFIQEVPNTKDAQQLAARFERNACTPQMFREIMLRNLEIDVRAVLPTIATPSLVMHTLDDPVVAIGSGRYLAENISDATLVEHPGNYHLSWDSTKLRWITEALGAFLGAAKRAPEPTDRVLATVLFTDIVGSTARAAAEGDSGWRTLLDRHDAIASAQVDRCQGRLIKTTGDGILATFDGPGRAILCAQEMTRQAGNIGLALRAGVHTGEIERRGSDITGLGVVIARRICDTAGDGELLASRTVKDLVTGSGIKFADRGAHELKGVPDDWQLFAIA